MIPGTTAERIRKKLREKLLSYRGKLRGEYVHRILGDRLFDREIWRMSERSLAGGLPLGLFIAFTPTISVQMLLSAILAIWLRVNLPIALAACWVTNPLTAVPVYGLAFKLGRWLVGCLPSFIKAYGFRGPTAHYFANGLYLVIGGIVLGTLAALMGYVLVRLAWRVFKWRESPDEGDDEDEDPD
ncbi:MAG: DUF2062 domain-containing protein [Syntrophales bacterium]|nr:DUF2062 domain-containing protein [Syntrophales bacterium]MCK9527430.1 DUF2062 domain-containing protein [Syntrophales bacterium]MDX9921532.1 DUF2062 domain-containing protein [Syntrophales bacterium]